MPLRNGEHGYGGVTKTLHWLTVAAITGQFVVGYSMDAELDDHGGDDGSLGALDDGRGGGDDGDNSGPGGGDDGGDDGGGGGGGGDDEHFEDAFDSVVHGDLFQGGVSLPELHVVLGFLIVALAVARLLWRNTTPLPPWAEALSKVERILESGLEKLLILLLFLLPISGLLLVANGDDDWLPLHVGAHVAFFVVVALHVGLVLKHTVIQRDRHLARML